MKEKITVVALVVILMTSLSFSASADWRSDGNGGWRGTGDDFGSGWRSDGNGGFRGTGDNFGSGWRSDGNGGYRGTGDNFGRRIRVR
jgi:hypothetical protein